MGGSGKERTFLLPFMEEEKLTFLWTSRQRNSRSKGLEEGKESSEESGELGTKVHARKMQEEEEAGGTEAENLESELKCLHLVDTGELLKVQRGKRCSRRRVSLAAKEGGD